MDAIARSDGSRASVARALLATRLQDGAVGPVAFDSRGDLSSPPVALLRLVRGGGSRAVASTEGADLITVHR
jgi:ABC-type branched-subunit amino acid transport system substrate-binding protein